MAQQCSDMDVPKVLSMGRSALVEAILGVDCDFPVDFSQAELR